MTNRKRFAFTGVVMILSLGLSHEAWASRSGGGIQMPPVADHEATPPQAPSIAEPAAPGARAENDLVFPENFKKLVEVLKTKPAFQRATNLELFDQPGEGQVEAKALDKEAVEKLVKRVTTLQEYIASFKKCDTKFSKKFTAFFSELFLNPIIEGFRNDGKFVDESVAVESVARLEAALKAYEKAYPEAKLADADKKAVENMKEIVKSLFGDFREAKLAPYLARLKADGGEDLLELREVEIEKAIASGKEEGEAACKISKEKPKKKTRSASDEEETEVKPSETDRPLERAPLPPSKNPVVNPTVPPQKDNKKDDVGSMVKEMTDLVRAQMEQERQEQAKKDAEQAKLLRDTRKLLEKDRLAKEQAEKDAEKAKADEEKKKKDEQLKKLAEADKAKKEEKAAAPHPAPVAPKNQEDDDSAPARKIAPPQNPASQQSPQGPQGPQGGGAGGGDRGTSSDSGSSSPADSGSRFSNADGMGSLVAPLVMQPGAINPAGGLSAVRDLDNTVMGAMLSRSGTGTGQNGRPNVNGQSLAGQQAVGSALPAMSNPATYNGVSGLAQSAPGARTPFSINNRAARPMIRR